MPETPYKTASGRVILQQLTKEYGLEKYTELIQALLDAAYQDRRSLSDAEAKEHLLADIQRLFDNEFPESECAPGAS
ncbi:MAG: hypothetical protein GY862_15960 [Gammaproteobacteria bacterium]|nr:hypothetical protein [Gammaproteobacteria bacterium]